MPRSGVSGVFKFASSIFFILGIDNVILFDVHGFFSLEHFVETPLKCNVLKGAAHTMVSRIFVPEMCYDVPFSSFHCRRHFYQLLPVTFSIPSILCKGQTTLVNIPQGHVSR